MQGVYAGTAVKMAPAEDYVLSRDVWAERSDLGHEMEVSSMHDTLCADPRPLSSARPLVSSLRGTRCGASWTLRGIPDSPATQCIQTIVGSMCG